MAADGSTESSRLEAVLLIARRHDLNRLLGSPACPPGLVTRVDARVPDRTVPDEPFVAMTLEEFEERGDSAIEDELDRNLLRHSGRRIVTLHAVEDDDEVQRVHVEMALVRDRLERLAGFQAQHEARWYPILIFKRPIRSGEIAALKEGMATTIEGRRNGRDFRVGRIPTMYVMDRVLHMTSSRELLLSEFVWPAFVVPLLLRIQNIQSDSSEENDGRDVCAWRLLEVGPSIPKSEFGPFFRELLARWRDERRGSPPMDAKAARPLPEPEGLSKLEVKISPIRFADPLRDGLAEDIVREGLPSAGRQAKQRKEVGATWLKALRGHWKATFSLGRGATVEAASTWESACWEKVREDPAWLMSLSSYPVDRSRLHRDILEQTKAWREQCEKATKWHRDRLKTLARAQLQDRKERHFVSLGGRLLLASFVSLLVHYVFMAILEPVVPGTPWWLYGGVLGGVFGASLAAVWSHRVERIAGEDWAGELDGSLRRLAEVPLPKRTLILMREGVRVGAAQAETFSREIVSKIATRARRSIERADGTFVAGRVEERAGSGFDAFAAMNLQKRQDSIADDALAVRTHGTHDPAGRAECFRDWEKSTPDESGRLDSALARHKQQFIEGWTEGISRIDETAAGHFPHQELMDFWGGIVTDRQRAIYKDMMSWIAGNRTVHAKEDGLSKELLEKFLRPGSRSNNLVGLTCRIPVPEDLHSGSDVGRSGAFVLMASPHDVEQLRVSLSSTDAGDHFRRSFPDASRLTSHWSLDGRVFLFHEVDVPDDFGCERSEASDGEA